MKKSITRYSRPTSPDAPLKAGALQNANGSHTREMYRTLACAVPRSDLWAGPIPLGAVSRPRPDYDSGM